MSNQNAWSFHHNKFILDLGEEGKARGWPFIQPMSSKLESGVRIQVILWKGGGELLTAEDKGKEKTRTQ